MVAEYRIHCRRNMIRWWQNQNVPDESATWSTSFFRPIERLREVETIAVSNRHLIIRQRFCMRYCRLSLCQFTHKIREQRYPRVCYSQCQFITVNFSVCAETAPPSNERPSWLLFTIQHLRRIRLDMGFRFCSLRFSVDIRYHLYSCDFVVRRGESHSTSYEEDLVASKE